MNSVEANSIIETPGSAPAGGNSDSERAGWENDDPTEADDAEELLASDDVSSWDPDEPLPMSDREIAWREFRAAMGELIVPEFMSKNLLDESLLDQERLDRKWCVFMTLLEPFFKDKARPEDP